MITVGVGTAMITTEVVPVPLLRQRVAAAQRPLIPTLPRPCPATQAYIARRTAEGKTIREIKRCLKRYITRELFRALTVTMTPTTNNPAAA
jgi:hypothetical protein